MANFEEGSLGGGRGPSFKIKTLKAASLHYRPRYIQGTYRRDAEGQTNKVCTIEGAEALL